MKYEELKHIKEAPEAGTILAYTRKQVIFNIYTSLNEVEQLLGEEELLELHLFDEVKEYRSIMSVSLRFPDGYVETVETKDSVPEDGDSVYSEEVLLERKYRKNGLQKLKVLNHVAYDEQGMTYIDTYRLMLGGR